MTTVTFRADEHLQRLLVELARPGATRTDTIRRALQEAASFERRRRMRLEALALSSDEVDRAESRAVLDDVEGARAW